MKMIAEIVEDIREELDGAEHYAKKSTQYKDEDRELADVYAKLAGVELDHVNALHGQVVRIIKAWEAKSGEQPPAAMKVVFDWEHNKEIEKVKQIKILLDLYRQ